MVAAFGYIRVIDTGRVDFAGLFLVQSLWQVIHMTMDLVFRLMEKRSGIEGAGLSWAKSLFYVRFEHIFNTAAESCLLILTM